MGLEAGTYISSLNSANPTSSDPKTQGDDHFRLVKSTILNTFPNITGAVTPTHTELNYVDGVTSAIQTQLDAKLGNANWSFSTNRLVNGGNTQTSFSAIRTSQQNSGTTIIFNSAGHNYGSAYNTSTGEFTAPVTGVYLFCTVVAVVNNSASASVCGISLYTNGGEAINSNHQDAPAFSTQTRTISCILALSANDVVTIRRWGGFSWASNNYVENGSSNEKSLFSGRLLG